MDPDFPNPSPQQPQQPQQTYQPTDPLPQNNQLPEAPQPAGQDQYGSGDIGPGGDNTTKKLLIIIGALIGLVVVIVIIVLAFSKGGDNPTEKPKEAASGEFYVKEPSAVDVESVNNSISDNISGLNTDADFPEDKLNDQSLGL